MGCIHPCIIRPVLLLSSGYVPLVGIHAHVVSFPSNQPRVPPTRHMQQMLLAFEGAKRAQQTDSLLPTAVDTVRADGNRLMLWPMLMLHLRWGSESTRVVSFFCAIKVNTRHNRAACRNCLCVVRRPANYCCGRYRSSSGSSSRNRKLMVVAGLPTTAAFCVHAHISWKFSLLPSLSVVTSLPCYSSR